MTMLNLLSVESSWWDDLLSEECSERTVKEGDKKERGYRVERGGVPVFMFRCGKVTDNRSEARKYLTRI